GRGAADCEPARGAGNQQAARGAGPGYRSQDPAQQAQDVRPVTLGIGIRFKVAVAVSLVALTLVAVTTAVHLAQLSRVVVEEAGRPAPLVGPQIFAHSGRGIPPGWN